MKVKWLILVCLLMAVLVTAGCAPTKAPPKAKAPAGYESIRLVGSSLGGKSTTVAMVMATIFNKYYPEIEWTSSSGSTAVNPIYLTKGTIKVGQVTPANYIDAYGFDKIAQSRLRSIIFPSATSHYVFLIPEDKPWKDITQVPKGLNFSPGTPGAGPTIAAEALLRLVGMSKEDFRWIPLSKSEQADAWRGGKLDFAFASLSAAEPFLFDMWQARKFKLMGLSPEQAAKAKAELTFERLGFESPRMGMLAELAPEFFKYDVVSPHGTTMLNVRDDFPEEIAYRMAKILDERNAEAAQIFAAMKYATPQWHVQWAKPPMDIHAGVARYYKEKGYLK